MEFATQTSIQMTGAGLLGRDTASAGKSKRITIGAGLSLATGVLTNTTDLTSYLTSSAAALAYQPLDGDLTALAGLTPSNDDFVQRKAGAWSNRTIAQVKTDLGLTGTNSGDQTITLTGDITGSGTGSFATTIAASSVSLLKMANVATGTIFYRKTASTGVPEVQTLATLKTDLALTGTNSGDQDLSAYLTSATAASTYVSLAGAYTNPSWIVSLPSTKITGLGTLATQNGTFSGTSSGTNTGDQSLAAYLTSATAASTYQPLDSDLTAIAALAPSNDDFIQRKLGVWTNRTVALVKTDLGLTGTNSGDQTITLSGDVSGSGTGAFTATIGSGVVSLAKLADMATASVYYRKTGGTGSPEVQTLATLKTDLGLTGTNSGDNAVNTLYSGLVSNATHTGDVTGSTTLTIAAGAVSLAKMANMATASLIYRKTASTGAPEVQTLATLKTDLGLTGTNSGDQDLSSYLTSATAATTYQPVDADLTAIAGLTSAANKIPYFSGSGTAAVADYTALARTITAATTAAGVLTAISLPQVDPTTANTFRLVNSTTAQSFELYRTYTDATTHEGIRLIAGSTTGNPYELSVFTGTVGGSNRGIVIGGYALATPTTFNKWLQFTSLTGECGVYGNGNLRVYQHSDDVAAAILTFRKYRGTEAVPAAVTSNDVLGQVLFQGYNGATITTTAAVQGVAAENFTSTSAATKLMFNTASTLTTTSAVRMIILDTGNVGIGTGALIASARTHILSTTEQLRVAYDSGNYCSATVSSVGGVTFDAVGTTPTFAFSDVVTVNGGLFVDAGTSYVSNYASPAQVRMRRAQGTQAAPTQTVAGANLGLFGGMGYKDTGGWSSSWSGYVQFTAAEAITGTTSGGYFTFWTTPTTTTTEVMRVWCGAAGNFGIGVFAAEPTTKLTINGDALRIMTAKTPASSAAAGNAGELCWDTTYLYGCTAANTWKRIAWTTF